MFKQNKKQFINIINCDNQIKIDQVILKDNKIIKQDQSAFVSYDQTIMPNDVKLKLKTLQDNITNSYLVALYDTLDQQLCFTPNCDDTQSEYIIVDNNSCIATTKTDLMKYLNYFKTSGIDYLISPFTILFKLINSSNSDISNSLNCFVYNNILYILIIDQNKKVIFGKNKSLTKYDDIKESKFYDNNAVVKQLYEEIYYLEFEQILNDTVQEYYKTSRDAQFLTRINIFHTKEQLNVAQLDSINESLMATVSYDPIDIDNVIYSLINTIDAQKYSFIKPRKKEQTGKKLLWFGVVILSLLATAGVLYFKLSQTKQIEQQKKHKINTVKKVVKQKPILLPDHIQNNTKIIENILTIFDTIAYDGVLKELKLDKDNLTIVGNFIIKSKSIDQLKEILQKYYKDVKIVLQHNNKANTITNIILKANKKLIQNRDQSTKEYKKLAFIPIAKAIQYLKDYLIKDSIIRFVSQENKNYTKFSFNIISYVQTPDQFFTMIENLNKNNFDITINYPISFTKLDDKIQIKYKVEFYQYNKVLK